MRLDLTGRHVVVSPGLRQLVERRLDKLRRQINDAGLAASVIVSRQRFAKVVEVNLHARGEHFLNAVGEGATWEAAVTAAVEKVLRQARTLKGKWQERRRRGPAARSARVARRVRQAPRAPAPPARPAIVRASRHAVKPMTADEAALELESRADQFLVFRDAATEAVCVLYRRKDGRLGLIAPEA